MVGFASFVVCSCKRQVLQTWDAFWHGMRVFAGALLA